VFGFLWHRHVGARIKTMKHEAFILDKPIESDEIFLYPTIKSPTFTLNFL
jgi:hypothetical protein